MLFPSDLSVVTDSSLSVDTDAASCSWTVLRFNYFCKSTYTNLYSWVDSFHTQRRFWGHFSVANFLGLAREDSVSILNPVYKAVSSFVVCPTSQWAQHRTYLNPWRNGRHGQQFWSGTRLLSCNNLTHFLFLRFWCDYLGNGHCQNGWIHFPVIQKISWCQNALICKLYVCALISKWKLWQKVNNEQSNILLFSFGLDIYSIIIAEMDRWLVIMVTWRSHGRILNMWMDLCIGWARFSVGTITTHGWQWRPINEC